MSDIIFNNTDFDAFTGKKTTTNKTTAKQSLVHIRSQQRNGRKCLTTIAGLASDLDLQKILKCMRKMFSTNGTILHDEDGNEVIQLQGDRRHETAEFLVKYCVVESKDEIQVHGF
eukprot:UN02508